MSNLRHLHPKPAKSRHPDHCPDAYEQWAARWLPCHTAIAHPCPTCGGELVLQTEDRHAPLVVCTEVREIRGRRCNFITTVDGLVACWDHFVAERDQGGQPA